MRATTAWVLALGLSVTPLTGTVTMADDNAPEQKQQTLTKTETRFDLMKCPKVTIDAFNRASDAVDKAKIKLSSDLSSIDSALVAEMALFGLTRRANYFAQQFVADPNVGGLSEQQAFEKIFCPHAEAISFALEKTARNLVVNQPKQNESMPVP